MLALPNSKDRALMKRFYLTELFANLVGAPLAAAYGGFMIDFSRFPLGSFLLSVVLIMAANQLLLALPMNLLLGKSLRRRLAAWRSQGLEEEGRDALHAFLSRLPLLQAALVFLRILLASAAVLLLIASGLDSFYHVAAIFTFGLYSSFIAGLFIYYYLKTPSSRIAEDLVLDLGALSVRRAAAGGGRLEPVIESLPLLGPSFFSTLGVFFLLLAIRRGGADVGFYSFRIAAALVLNIVTVCPILVFSRHFHRKRLRLIRAALEDMTERGDTTRSIPTDLGDDYALTAQQINKAFDLFRIVLSQMESASSKLSGTVMSFSSQLRETVAATSQQASAVKEMVGTMEGSNQINRQIEERARALSGNAQESHVFVDEGFGKVQDTIRKMDEIKKANIQTLGEIGELTEEISSIGEIIEIINSIANQTRIIAFNAELEASSAGAAGISFRIVAEEIRRLANSTVDSLVGIKGRISQIQQGSDRLQATSEEGTVKIEEGMRLSSDLNDIFTRIRESAESTSDSADGIGTILLEQGQAFDQIFTTLKQISEGAEQVLASTKISGTEVGKLQALIDELKLVLTRFDYERDAGSKAAGGSAGATQDLPAQGEAR